MRLFFAHRKTESFGNQYFVLCVIRDNAVKIKPNAKLFHVKCILPPKLAYGNRPRNVLDTFEGIHGGFLPREFRGLQETFGDEFVAIGIVAD